MERLRKKESSTRRRRRWSDREEMFISKGSIGSHEIVCNGGAGS